MQSHWRSWAWGWSSWFIIQTSNPHLQYGNRIWKVTQGVRSWIHSLCIRFLSQGEDFDFTLRIGAPFTMKWGDSTSEQDESSWTSPCTGIVGMSSWEETQRPTQNTLEGQYILHLSCLKIPHEELDELPKAWINTPNKRWTSWSSTKGGFVKQVLFWIAIELQSESLFGHPGCVHGVKVPFIYSSEYLKTQGFNSFSQMQILLTHGIYACREPIR